MEYIFTAGLSICLVYGQKKQYSLLWRYPQSGYWRNYPSDLTALAKCKMWCNNTINAELALNTSEFRILSQTRWIVRAGSFQGTFDDWLLVLQLMEKNYADIAGIV